ncbi:MAG: lipid-A-disaccharide synthase [Gammaproteobacteria bacterium]|nr:lipid-A-disaccharide synthase [Gammaproteobacteria bacterium]
MISSDTLFVVAGEASGDLHGANLVKEILKERPDIKFYAMGSQQLAKAGAKIVVDAKGLGIVGFSEVLSKLNQISRAFKKTKQAILELQPKIVILIDYPGFNLRLAKAIKKSNPDIKIIYYISPQIWAWRYKRIHLIKKVVDLMAVIFPFEVAIYKNASVPVRFVGHPLVDEIKVTRSPTENRQFFGLKQKSKIIGLMPGSRHSEIKNLFPIIIKTAQILKKEVSDIEFILPLAPTLSEKDLEPFLRQTQLRIKIVKENHYDAIATCDVVVVASGTATLEVAMLAKPMVVLYKGSSVSYAIAKWLVRVPYVSLCNIVANEGIVTELLQAKATPRNIVKEVKLILEDQPYALQMIMKLQKMGHQLKQQNVTESLTNIILKLMN